jgi:hypothetical protein
MRELLKAWALFYARMGYPVFPVTFRGKAPEGRLVPQGLKEATLDREKILSWWGKEPLSIGVVPPAEVLVLDVDEPGVDLDLERRYPLLRLAPKSRSGKGGSHLYLRVGGEALGKLKPRVRALPGVDLRGLGRSYLVAPPSLHSSGKPYIWERPLVPPARLPVLEGELLREILRALEPPPPPPLPQGDAYSPAGAGGSGLGRLERRVEGILREVFERVSALPKGMRHQESLRIGGWGLGKMKEAGAPPEAYSRLWEALWSGLAANGLAQEDPKEAEGIIRFLKTKA